MARADDELDTADGPAFDRDELDTADGPAFDRDDEALIAKLRALPAEGDEPNWRHMEAAIRSELREHRMPVPWWRSWRYLVPLSALAVTAGVALVVLTRSDAPPARTSMVSPRDAGVEPPPAQPASARASAMWLDGEAVQIDDVEPSALDVSDSPGDDTIDGLESADDDDNADGILPVTDYGWIDTLDEDAIARAESWLARKRS